MRRIGILETSSPDAARMRLWDVFRVQLNELGYAEGTEIVFEFRWANGNASLLPQLAHDLVKAGADVIVTAGTPAGFAAASASSTLPVVMATGVSVDVSGASSLPALGKNVTGLSDLAPGLSRTRLLLLHQMVPQAKRLGVLWDQSNQAGSLVVREYEDAAHSLGVTAAAFGVRGRDDFDQAMAAMQRAGVSAFIGVTSAMFFGERLCLAELALGYRLPTMFVRKEYAQAGALMAFGAPIEGNYVIAARCVDRIFKGAKPCDVPVEQPTNFELVINVKSARSLGLTVPDQLLEQARLLD